MAGIDTSFFEESADLWKDNKTFNNSIEIISSLAVVNDGAERGVSNRVYFCSKTYILKQTSNNFQYKIKLTD